MERQTFSVSIKGILYKDGKYLLRKNQRNEYELLGGRLEGNDQTPEERIVKEFMEESGIEVKVETYREPWLYEIAKKNIIIVPYICSIISCPNELIDNDGGIVQWIEREELDTINIPIGYIDSIRNVIPRKGFSILPGDYFKIIPNYTERDYYIKVVMKNLNGEEIISDYLEHFVSPRQFLKEKLGEKYISENIISQPISREKDTVILNYISI